MEDDTAKRMGGISSASCGGASSWERKRRLGREMELFGTQGTGSAQSNAGTNHACHWKGPLLPSSAVDKTRTVREKEMHLRNSFRLVSPPLATELLRGMRPVWAGRQKDMGEQLMKPKTKKAVVFSSLVVMSLAAPVAFSSASGIVPNNACGQDNPLPTGTCCPQYNSICNAGGDDHTGYYYLAAGRC